MQGWGGEAVGGADNIWVNMRVLKHTRAEPTFDGDTFEAVHDQARLITLLDAVKLLMQDGAPRTLAEIRAGVCRGTEASISARLRDLRKPKFGGLNVRGARRGNPKDGLWEYWVERPVAP